MNGKISCIVLKVKIIEKIKTAFKVHCDTFHDSYSNNISCNRWQENGQHKYSDAYDFDYD